MSTKHEQRLTISLFPWVTGLSTAGQQTSIPEDRLWRAQNVTAGLAGLLSKRPPLAQWGQTLVSPDEDASGSTVRSFVDFLSGINGFVSTDSSSGKIVQDVSQTGVLKTAVSGTCAVPTCTESYTLSHGVSALSAGSKWSLRFVFSGTNLPAYVSGTTPKTMIVRGQAASGSGKEFALFAGGLYYKRASDNTYVLVTDTEKVGTGAWTVIELQVDDAGGSTRVYIDDVLVETLVSSTLADATLTGTSDFEFKWTVEGSGAASTSYNTQIVTPMYNDSVSTPFAPETIVAIKDFQYITSSSARRSALLCAAGDYLYADNGLTGVFRPLKGRQHSHMYMLEYRRTLIWIDHNGADQTQTWQWTGYTEPEQLDDAPTIHFGVEHQQRVIAAGDPDNPLRLYISGDRQPNLWFSPAPDNIEDTYDAALEAGYLEIPSGRGDKITAVFGDYYGDALIWTTRGAWRMRGFGPGSWTLVRVAGVDVGCESEHGATQVGNDIWFIGRQGIQSLITTDQAGDIKTQYPSIPIQNLWGQEPSSVTRITTQYLSEAKLEMNPQTGLVFAAVPLTGETTPSHVFVFNTNTQSWLGPWLIDSQAMANIELGSPRIEVMAHGGADGRVKYTAQAQGHRDPGDEAIHMLLESAALNGRSLDPKLATYMKAWKELRLLVLPRGNWEFEVSWHCDATRRKGPVTKSQNPGGDNRAYVLSEDWKIGADPDGILRSREDMVWVKIPLDIRGYSLSFVVEDDILGQDLVIQGAEVDFTVSGYEGK